MGKKKKNPKKMRNWENFNTHWITISRITSCWSGSSRLPSCPLWTWAAHLTHM
uniref:Synaptotagmin 1 n=1 Tax=Myotis myotis TaxID=51298 RepID=A0A7J7Z962_MYOMY|nr:synaptotagmin 1 [Myotis myotis]